MKVTLLCEGRVRDPHAPADAHYRRLLSRYLALEVVEARDERDLVRRLPPPGRARVVALDREGTPMASEAWARWLEGLLLAARPVVIAIGGADGLPREARERADESVSLGPQTLAHQLARVVVLEQLYRAARIRAGEPYHR